tara:strand:- start:4450 stop:5898 length:1449 start_codon:yes stop_codon:yes gene_type:complete
VVYDHLSRAPLPLVNRKAVLGLGRDVERFGRLSDELIEQALDSIEALVRMAQDVPVSSLDLLATAGVRSAENGDALCMAIKGRTGHEVSILSGNEEARLSAMGVMSAVPGLTGVIGDLGGGSLELIAVREGAIVDQTSLEIGALRLIERAEGDLAKAPAIVNNVLEGVTWLKAWRDQPFYAVGGAWRAVARLHMAQQAYPLQMVHGYRMALRETRDFIELLEHLGPKTIAKIQAVSPKRAETIPWGSVVLECLSRTLRPDEFFYSAHGLREGHHFRMLDTQTQLEDPLLTACHELAGQHRRFADASETLLTWLSPLLARMPAMTERLARSACIIADMGWGEHPTYRAPQSMLRVLRMPWSVLDHLERAFLALAVFVRYGGSSGSKFVADCHRLLDEDAIADAKALGKALRLALEICSGRGPVLAATRIEDHDSYLVLAVRQEALSVGTDKIERYAASTGRALHVPIKVVIEDRGPEIGKAAR